jgi:hypothetical protein
MARVEAEGSSEKPHDVLAAEFFPMPSADPALHHGPVRPPGDPSGIVEPHDVLAAEEFPMPALYPHPRGALAAMSSPRAGALRWVLGLTVLGLTVRLLRRR